MNVDGGGLAQESIDGVQVEKFSPTFDCGSAKNHLRDVLFANELRGGLSNVFAFQTNGFAPRLSANCRFASEPFPFSWPFFSRSTCTA